LELNIDGLTSALIESFTAFRLTLRCTFTFLSEIKNNEYITQIEGLLDELGCSSVVQLRESQWRQSVLKPEGSYLPTPIQANPPRHPNPLHDSSIQNLGITTLKPPGLTPMVNPEEYLRQ
jgi:hypothetical protein